MFTLMIDKPRSWMNGDTHYMLTNEAWHACWEFEDGVKVTITDRFLTNTYRRGKYSWFPRTELTKAPRLYVDVEETILDNLQDRCRRPYLDWKPRVREALERIGLETKKLAWNQHAGCSMCPCSPGFILDAGLGSFDIWVTLPGAPVVDESKPPRVLVSSI